MRNVAQVVPCAGNIEVMVTKEDIINRVLDALHDCMQDMMSSNEEKAKAADIRFQSLSAGLYQIIKSL